MLTSIPEINKKIIFFLFLIIFLNSPHLEKIPVVIINKTAVQIVLCTVNSIGVAKDTNLKYKVPNTPHHKEANAA